MNPEQLKLYNKYKHDKYPNRKYIYIGMEYNDAYCFLFKDKDAINMNINYLNYCGLNSEQIVKDLNLETYIDIYGKKIKGYNCHSFNKGYLIFLKPCLKDKLKNIINR